MRSESLTGQWFKKAFVTISPPSVSGEGHISTQILIPTWLQVHWKSKSGRWLGGFFVCESNKKWSKKNLDSLCCHRSKHLSFSQEQKAQLWPENEKWVMSRHSILTLPVTWTRFNIIIIFSLFYSSLVCLEIKISLPNHQSLDHYWVSSTFDHHMLIKLNTVESCLIFLFFAVA